MGQRQRARGRELAVEQRQEELGVGAALSLLSNGDGSRRSSHWVGGGQCTRAGELGPDVLRRRREEEEAGLRPGAQGLRDSGHGGSVPPSSRGGRRRRPEIELAAAHCGGGWREENLTDDSVLGRSVG